MLNVFSRKLFAGLTLIAISILLSACEFRKKLPSCTEFLTSKPQKRFQISDESPVAYDTTTKIKWYRCNGGQTFVDGNCVGEPLELNWLEAQSFAREFSQSSGETWKVARYWQLRELQRNDCINPALDTRVFPGLKIGHYWSRDGHIFGDSIACSLYTYKGQGYCWQRKKIELPFLLVSDENAMQVTFLGKVNRILIDLFN